MKKEIKETKETKKVVAKKIVKKPVKKVEELVVEKKSTKKLPKIINLKTIIIFLIIAAAIMACFKYAIVATVDGRPISRIEYVKQLIKTDKKSVLNQMIQENLILTEAKKNNINIEQKDIDADVASIEAQIVSQGETLEAAMKTEGITREDLEKNLRLTRIVKALSATSSEITQAQIDEFITKNKEQLPTNMSKEQIQNLVKEELESQAQSTAQSTWLQKIYQEAKIIYK